MKKSKPFAALSASALALPAISVESIASAAPDDITIGYRYSQYLEDNMSNASGTTTGSDERYQIGVQQFDISGGYGNVSFNANFQTEHLSGASPQVTLYNTDGSPRIHSTNASIIEDRNEISGSLRYHMPTVEIGVMGGVSDEDDYDSQYGGVNASFEVDNKAITINVGATYAQDTLFPTSYKSTTQVGDIAPDPITEPGRYAAWQQEKAKLSIFTGASFIINRNTVGQVGVSYTNLSGFLSDPYREYLVGNGADRQMYHYDRRPDVRNSFTGSAGIRHHVAAINGTAHGDYRLFVDDWGIVSNTVDLSW